MNLPDGSPISGRNAAAVRRRNFAAGAGSQFRAFLDTRAGSCVVATVAVRGVRGTVYWECWRCAARGIGARGVLPPLVITEGCEAARTQRVPIGSDGGIQWLS